MLARIVDNNAAGCDPLRSIGAAAVVPRLRERIPGSAH
jgi:hypothetical protein